jgi:hypothetical protein
MFDKSRDDYSDLMTLDQFNAAVGCGAFIPTDGCGWIGTETHFSYDHDVWEWYLKGKKIPSTATHVHWYNK